MPRRRPKPPPDATRVPFTCFTASPLPGRRSHPHPLLRPPGARPPAPPADTPSPRRGTAAPRPSRGVSPRRPGRTQRAARRHRQLRCVTPAGGRALPRRRPRPPPQLRPWQRAATCGLSCKASSRRSLSTAGMLARLGAGSWMLGGGGRPLARPGGGARRRPSPRGRPRLSVVSGAQRLAGSAGGAGAAARGRSLLPVPVRRRKRVTGRAGGGRGVASCRH